MNVMFDLQNIAALVYYAKGLSVESIDDANTDVLSENFIRQVCGELSQIKLLDEYCYPEILQSLIHLYRLKISTRTFTLIQKFPRRSVFRNL